MPVRSSQVMQAAPAVAAILAIAGVFGCQNQGPAPATPAPAQAVPTPPPACICECPRGQSLAFADWSRRFGDDKNQIGAGVAVDRQGNVILTGGFEGTIDFGQQPLSAIGRQDIYLSKFNSAGEVLWNRSFGLSAGEGFHGGRGVAVDAFGNIIVAGDFSGSVDFGGGRLVSADSYDIFLVKFDPEGKHLWSKRFGGPERDLGSSVAVDNAGNLILTGEFRAKIDFGGKPLVSAGGVDIFVAKFDPTGKHVFSRGFGGKKEDFGTGVATDDAGNVIVMGEYTDSVDFGNGLLRTAMGYDIFIAKFDPKGAHIWSDSYGPLDSAGVHGARSVSVDRTGHVIVTGDFTDTITFGGNQLVSAGGYDVFVAKFDEVGKHIWSKRFGDAGWDHGDGVSVDGLGNILITGSFHGSVDFGGGPLSSGGGPDAFVVKLDPWGNHMGSRNFGDRNMQSGLSIVASSQGSVLVAGSFQGGIDLGRGEMRSAGGDDVFLAKLAP